VEAQGQGGEGEDEELEQYGGRPLPCGKEGKGQEQLDQMRGSRKPR
jgi:hypothetical protein